MPRLMTETETAVMVGMSVHWLRRKRWEGGGIPFIKMTKGGAVRYSEEVVKNYLESHYCTCTREAGNIPAEAVIEAREAFTAAERGNMEEEGDAGQQQSKQAGCVARAGAGVRCSIGLPEKS